MSRPEEIENKVFMIVLYGGDMINVEATDCVDAAVKASELVDRKEIFQIIDIPG